MIGLKRYAPAGANPVQGLSLSTYRDGLRAAWMFAGGNVDLVNGGNAGTFGGTMRLVGAWGMGTCLDASAAARLWTLAIPTYLQIGMPLTIVFRARTFDASLNANRVGIFRDGSNSGYGVACGTGGAVGNFRLQWSSGVSAGTLNTTLDERNSYPQTFAARFTATYRDLWVDGVFRDGVSGAYSNATYSGTPTLLIGSSLNPSAYIEYVLLYARVFTPSEMADLAVNPYAWLSASPWATPITMAASASGALSPFLVGCTT